VWIFVSKKRKIETNGGHRSEYATSKKVPVKSEGAWAYLYEEDDEESDRESG
jgi:hypothetical protein